MSRYILLIFLTIIVCVGSFAQKQYKVFGWNGEGTLSTYLAVRAREHYSQREAAVEKTLLSKSAMLQYRAQSIRKFTSLLGRRPDTGSMHPVITGVIQRDGYRIEKLVFESFAHHHVTANVYIPEGKGPFPATLIFCGHETEAKATESYQRTAILFAKNGFVVLMADPISQGERFQLTKKDGTPATRGGTAEHSLLNVGAITAGTSVAAYELWDNVRGLDYLETRPEVDKARIGCLGNSGGGTQTAYMIAYDQRIKVSALCSYVLNNDPTIEYKGPPDGCVPIPGEIRAGLTDGDYFAMFLPKPVLVLAGRYDFIRYNQVSHVFAETKKMYKVMGVPEKAAMLSVDDGHGITQPKREAAVNWFRKWLYHNNTQVREGEETILTAKELNCTGTGQVNSQFTDEITVADRNQQLISEMQAKRSRIISANDIRSVIGMRDSSVPLSVEQLGADTSKGGYRFQKIILRKPGAAPLPCLVFYPTVARNNSWVILSTPEQGKSKLADSTDFINTHLSSGHALVIADLRGFGEEAERDAINDTKYYNPVYRTSNTALLIGEPLTAQWADDIVTLTDFIKADPRLQKMRIELNTSGYPAYAALHVAALDPRITFFRLETAISSFSELLHDPLRTDLFPYVIPGATALYDLPDLLTMAGKHRVAFNEGPVLYR